MMKKYRVSALAGIPLVLGLTLTGCTFVFPGSPGGVPSAGSDSDVAMADSMFTMMMIPHHEQAIEMSDMLLAKTGIDDRVVALAEQIKAAQSPEIELMESWLDEWGLPSSGGMGDMGHSDGMMSRDDMDALAAADGAEAARLYLEQMIVHHEGAIEMAEDVRDAGSDPAVRELAESIIVSQTAEIEVMRELLGEV